MYALSNAPRIYVSFFLLLCSSLFSSAALANAPDGYWSTNERRFITQPEANARVERILLGATKAPSGSSINTLSTPPTFSTNALGGVSATTQNIIKTMGEPSSFSSTINQSAAAAKTALKSCVRSAACAGRVFGTGAVIYEGIKGWQQVYGFLLDENGVITEPADYQITLPYEGDKTVGYYTSVALTVRYRTDLYGGCQQHTDYLMMSCNVQNDEFVYRGCPNGANAGTGWYLAGFISPNTCEFVNHDPLQTERPQVPSSYANLDTAIDEGYIPSVTDAPIVLLSGAPESITLSTPPPVDLESTTTTNTNSNGDTTSSVTNKSVNYSVTNNNTSNPTINYNLVETTTNYDTTGNLTNTSTSTTTALGTQQAIPAQDGIYPVVDFELPAFCTWASIVCEWLGWTQEEFLEEEPDLTTLISEFEPDEDAFSLGIGSGTCPAPIQLNITFISQTVEVSYQPFCDFVTMIRPFILAAAYLFAAYLYIGVLKRG